MRVKLSEPCNWEGKRYEKGDVIEVPERTQELNANWMLPTDDTNVTDPNSRPTPEEFAAKETAKAEKAAAKEDKK